MEYSSVRVPWQDQLIEESNLIGDRQEQIHRTDAQDHRFKETLTFDPE